MNKKKDKKKIEDLDQIKKDIGGKGKKKMGRPSHEELAAKKAEEKAALLENMPGAESFEDMLSFLFNLLADRLGPHWILRDSEAKKGSELLNNVAQKYFPLIGEYAAEVALAMWLAPVVLIRAQITLTLQRAAATKPAPADEKGKES